MPGTPTSTPWLSPLRSPSCLPDAVAYFLSNFELGLRISAQRAARHLGRDCWIKESEHLDARLDSPDSMQGLSNRDYRDLRAYVRQHPRFNEAMAWHERMSGGRKMKRAEDA